MTEAHSPLGLFERYLSLWVALCIVTGVGLGVAAPSVFQSIAGMEYASVNLVIAVFSWLMLSKLRFFKFMPGKFNIASMWPQLILLIVGVAGWFALHVAIIPIVFLLYILLSFIHQPREV